MAAPPARVNHATAVAAAHRPICDGSLADAAHAHASIAARATVGKVTLVVDEAAHTTYAR